MDNLIERVYTKRLYNDVNVVIHDCIRVETTSSILEVANRCGDAAPLSGVKFWLALVQPPVYGIDRTRLSPMRELSPVASRGCLTIALPFSGSWDRGVNQGSNRVRSPVG